MILKKIKANNLTVGKTYQMALYSNKDIKIDVTVTKKPDCPIKSMTTDDRIIVKSDKDTYEFYRSHSHPFFLITNANNKKDRAIFYESQMHEVF